MTTTDIKYGKVLTVISENLDTKATKIFTSKISNLQNIIVNLECFAIRLNNNVCKKTIKKIEQLGFHIEIDENYGFEWESKLYCSI